MVEKHEPAGSNHLAAGPSPLAFAFAPIHKRALGVAVGSVFGLFIFVVTVFHVVLNPDSALDIALLREYFFGYTVSWQGAFIGLFWGFISGFVMGWFVAFVRNFVIAIRVFTWRAKGELARTADFLDHI